MIKIITNSVTRLELEEMADLLGGDLVKAVVDISRKIMAVGGELHSDEESLLLADGSIQQDLWGINLYPSMTGEAMIEFDSMINVRPKHGNRTRSVDDPARQATIVQIVKALVKE